MTVRLPGAQTRKCTPSGTTSAPMGNRRVTGGDSVADREVRVAIAAGEMQRACRAGGAAVDGEVGVTLFIDQGQSLVDDLS